MSTAPDPDANGALEAKSKPPFLRRVRIRGYKSIVFCDVTLEPLTIFVGRNASGKSNFLDALGFLRDVVHLGTSEAVKRHGGIDAILCRYEIDRLVSFEIECSYTDQDGESSTEAVFAIEIELPVKLRPHIRSESLKIDDDGYQMGYTNNEGRVVCFATNDQSIQWSWGNREHSFLVRYHNELRTEHVLWLLDGIASISIYNFQPERIRQLHPPSPGSQMESDGGNLASVIETTRENEEQAIARVNRYLTSITGTVGLLGVVKYGEYQTTRFQIASASSNQPLEFDAASMSDGTLRVLAALVAAFQSIPPYGFPSVVAIEEPETSLHPAAMRALVDALDEATLRTQILLTTHSADMLDNPTIKPENIRVVQMIDGQTIIAPVDEASVEIVRQKLNTLGGLERDNLLEPDFDDVERQKRLAETREESPT